MRAGLLFDPFDASASPGSRMLGPALILGFGDWLAFLLVLEPGNLLEMAKGGTAIPWDQEALRITGASLLGASATPPLLGLIRRFPIEGTARWRNGAIHLAACAGLAFLMILASCVLAGWLLAGERRALGTAIAEQLAANELLLVFCLAGFVAGGHAIRFRRRLDRPTPAPGWLETVMVRSRGRVEIVRLDEVDWIETQGNYLALHAGAATHLVRETLAGFEARLDPARFVRIHRRTLVAADRVRGLASLGGGDAEVRLRDGTVLRLSRGFRERLRAVLPGGISGSG
jgi:two-component system LytT family response regulator